MVVYSHRKKNELVTRTKNQKKLITYFPKAYVKSESKEKKCKEYIRKKKKNLKQVS